MTQAGREEKRARLLLEGHASGHHNLLACAAQGRRVFEPQWLKQLLLEAGGKKKALEKLYARLFSAALLGAAGAVWCANAQLLILPAVYALLEFLTLKQRCARRVFNFDRDYPTLLVALGSSVRAGLDVVEALDSVKELFGDDSEVKIQLAAFRRDLQSGSSKESALQSFAASIRHPDIPLFISAVLLNQQSGCSVSDALQRLVRVVRQRQSFRRKIRSAVAMQKMSAIGIGLAFCAILIFQLSANYEQVQKAFQEPLGKTLYAFGAGALSLGAIWMTALIRKHLACW